MGVFFVLLVAVTITIYSINTLSDLESGKNNKLRTSPRDNEFNEKEWQEQEYDLMSSLSKYEFIRGDVRKDRFDEKKCKMVKFWILHRHGTRFPSTAEIASIESLLPGLRKTVIENHKAGKGSLSQNEVNRIADWTFDPSIESTPLYLTASGFNETKRTSGRMKKRFSSLLNRKYDPKKFYFQHSETERTQKTSYAFIDGLFGDNAHQYVTEHVVPATQDTLLYPFGGVCPKLASLYSNNAYIYGETSKFQHTKEFNEAVELVRDRLGLEKKLTVSDLITIFSACAYDGAWNQETVPFGAWCPALGHKGRLMGEYYWDLFFQAYSGYSGEEVIAKAGCGPVKDLWERFGTAVGEINIPNKTEDVTALFSHDAQLLLTHRALGLLEDSPHLSGTNYRLQSKRQWRTSTIVPFASNIAAVLYKCTLANGRVEYSVLLLRNERRMTQVPGCNNGVCSWKNFKTLVKPVAESCNFHKFC